MGDVSIRAYASQTDWDAVRDIYDLSKPDEMRGAVDPAAIVPLDKDAEHLALFRESVILVAEKAGRIVGFGGHKGNYISWLFVHPGHRRDGIGRALLSEILQRLPGPLTLNVAGTNEAAQRLYAEFGFRIAKDFVGQFNGRDVRVLTLRRDGQAG